LTLNDATFDLTTYLSTSLLRLFFSVTQNDAVTGIHALYTKIIQLNLVSEIEYPT